MKSIHAVLLAASLLLISAIHAAAAVTIGIDSTGFTHACPSHITVTTDVVVQDSAGTMYDLPEGTLLATYFPNSIVASVETVAVMPDTLLSANTVTVPWTPRYAGIVTLNLQTPSESVSRNVSVKFPGVPAGGVLVFLAAGMILLGGAGWSLTHLMEHTPGQGDDDDDDD